MNFNAGLAAMTAVLCLSAGLASAQDFPSKPIRIITSGAGGGNDFSSRLIALGISGPLGQPVIVENRATTPVGAEAVAKAPADGSVLLVAGSSLWILPLLQKPPFDMVDFSPISLVSRDVNVFVLHPSLPVKSVKELIALAKAKPKDLNIATGATGTGSHLAAELFKSMAGVDMTRVPYKGSGPALTAVMGGDVHLTIYDAGVVAPHVKSGRLKALAVTSSTPSVLFPNLPTVAQTVPGYEAVGMTGIWAPAKTPAATVKRLNQEIVRVLNLPESKEKFLNQGSEIVGSSAEELAATIKSDTARMGKVIKDAGIKVE